MSSQCDQIEGIILKAMNFQDHDKILTVFSETLGVIKLIVKKGNTKQFPAHLTSPFTQAEFICTRGNSDLLKCQEISLIKVYPSFREDFCQLEAACNILKAVLDSQPAHTSAPQLYALCKSYLNKIARMENPHLLAESFRLKLLRHDGLLNLNPVCSICSAPLQIQYVNAGESYCKIHAPDRPLIFDEDESAAIVIMAYCQTFAQLEPIDLTPNLRVKIQQLFSEQMGC